MSVTANSGVDGGGAVAGDGVGIATAVLTRLASTHQAKVTRKEI